MVLFYIREIQKIFRWNVFPQGPSGNNINEPNKKIEKWLSTMADRILYERPWCSIIFHSKYKIWFLLTNHVNRIDMVRIYLPFVLFIAVWSIIIVSRCWYYDDRSNGDRKQFYPRDRNLRYHSYEYCTINRSIFTAMISKIATIKVFDQMICLSFVRNDKHIIVFDK